MSLIDPNDKSHVIKKFQFKKWDEDNSQKVEESVVKEQKEVVKKSESSIPNEFIKELLEKVDNLTETLVKLQMEASKEKEECEKRIALEKEKAFNEGVLKAKEEEEKKYQAELQNYKMQVDESIRKLELIIEQFKSLIKKAEAELPELAFNIAKEVIFSEISQNSSKVAFNLAKNLLLELKEAENIVYV